MKFINLFLSLRFFHVAQRIEIMFTSTVSGMLLSNVQDKAKNDDVDGVLNAIENFPYRRWVYILAPNRASTLEDVVQKFNPRVALELGMSYGYSAIRIARKMTKPESKLITVHGSNDYDVTRGIIERAGLSGKVEVLKRTSGKGILNELYVQIKQKMGEARYFDFIFIDHSPSNYLPDFLILLEKGFIGKGTVIVANTSPYPAAQDYLKYLKDHTEELDTATYNAGASALTVSTYIID